MTRTPTHPIKNKPVVKWEKLPPEYQLPDDPVENLHHLALASALKEILELAGFTTANMPIGSNFGICANVDGKTVVKVPDWFYVPDAFPSPIETLRRSYTPDREGEPVAIVMEFLSDTEQGEYSHNPRYPYGKWYFYEQILQVPVYAIFEPVEPSLEVYRLVGERYELQQPDINGRYWIEPIGLYLGTWFGTKAAIAGNWLRWWDTQGNILPWGIEGVVQSRQQGIQQGKVELINRLLFKRFGDLSPEIKETINRLSVTDLDELSEVVFDFSAVSDLSTWLENRSNS